MVKEIWLVDMGEGWKKEKCLTLEAAQNIAQLWAKKLPDKEVYVYRLYEIYKAEAAEPRIVKIEVEIS